MVKVFDNGNKHWYLNGKLHREDGPAIECVDGDKTWYLNGKRHRVDGPAIEASDGYRAWYLNGKRHCVSGPAVECYAGDKYWYLNDKQYTEAEFNAVVKPNCEGKCVEIDGIKYKLTAV